MTCVRTVINGNSTIVCGPSDDDCGEVKIGRRRYRWTFRYYFGPSFEKKRCKRQWREFDPPEEHPLWTVFHVWLKNRDTKDVLP